MISPLSNKKENWSSSAFSSVLIDCYYSNKTCSEKASLGLGIVTGSQGHRVGTTALQHRKEWSSLVNYVHRLNSFNTGSAQLKSGVFITDKLDQRYSIGGPRATYLWPPNCYFFSMCFGWVNTYTYRDLSPCQRYTDSLLMGHAASAFLSFTFEAVRMVTLPESREEPRLRTKKKVARKWRVPNHLPKERWTVKIANSKKNGLKNLHSFSLQPAQDPCA